MNENDENESLSSIGFMFDSMHEKIVKKVKFLMNSQEFSLFFDLIGEDPGHRQSGHYLWPAAQFLSSYLINHWETYQSPLIIELGAGIGLCGILCGYLLKKETISGTTALPKVILTDYDPGCINLLNSNIINNNCESICRTESLQWGESIQHLSIQQSDEKKILVIGSDLLYCTGVVEPLFQTVHQLLNSIHSNNGIFLLASSFDVGEDVNSAVSMVCSKLHLQMTEIFPLELPNQYRLQSFTLQSSPSPPSSITS